MASSSSLSVCALLASLGLAVGATGCSSPEPNVPCGNAGCFAACGCYLPDTGTDAAPGDAPTGPDAQNTSDSGCGNAIICTLDGGSDAPREDAATTDAPTTDAAGD